jgi:hypothetical protein
VERYNRTIVNALRGYVSERQNTWDEYTSAITFGYNCRIHSSLGLAPFELVLSRPPPSLSVEHPEPGTEDSHETAKLRFLKRLRELKTLAQRRLSDAQERYRRNYDNSVREKNKDIPVGAWVYLRKEVQESGESPKLASQAEGPYQVLETDGRTFVLRQGADRNRVSSDRVTPAPPPPETAGIPTHDSIDEHTPRGEDEYVMEKIVGAKKIQGGGLRYRVRWYGYSREEDTWEPADNLPDEAVRRYHQRTGLPREF